jgi:uncharacterized membrane protein YagU involved in acid resistance
MPFSTGSAHQLHAERSFMNFSDQGTMAEIRQGALAGFVATAPMTVVMWVLDRGRHPTERSLPPEQITRNLARRTGLHRFLNEPGKKAAAWVSHFGYGTATGAAYPLIAERILLSEKVKGPLYGFFIWALSYLGWLPAVRIMPPAPRQSAWRNLALVAAHAIWGLTCAGLYARLQRAGQSPSSFAPISPSSR